MSGYNSKGNNTARGQTVGGIVVDIGASPEKNLNVELDGNNLSAFGEITVQNPTPIIQTAFPYNINPFIVATSSVGAGTVATNASITHANSMAVLSTGTTDVAVSISWIEDQ